MTEKDQNGMQCSQFEALLPDLLDETGDGSDGSTQAGALSPELRGALQTHAASCPACGPIYQEARQGMFWLRMLEEVESPANLVHNILAATTAVEEAKEPALAKALHPAWAIRGWKTARGMIAAALQPRFATSFSMAFFSLSLTLTLAGVRLKDLARVDWRPSSVSKAVMIEYTQLESKVVRYYNNMRLVYEIESRVGQLKKDSGGGEKDQQPDQDQIKKDKNKKDNNDTSGRPEERRDNYSRGTDDATIAYLTFNHEGANQ